MTTFDLAMTDELLSTTRAVRKRLDFERPVELSVIRDCIDLSQQAPTGSNKQGWRWVVVTDTEKRRALADLYRAGADAYLGGAKEQAAERGAAQDVRVFDSAMYLAERFQDAPVHVVPCIEAGHIPADAPRRAWIGLGGSIFPAIWSFQLALRARGLGSCLTTLHLGREAEAAALLGIPENMVQIALLPVAYTKGTDFKPAKRGPADDIIHWESWDG